MAATLDRWARPILKESGPTNVGPVVDEAVTAALAGKTRDDSTFGDDASVFGFCRSPMINLIQLSPEANPGRQAITRILQPQ